VALRAALPEPLAALASPRHRRSCSAFPRGFGDFLWLLLHG
jgi:hypothetical protein